MRIAIVGGGSPSTPSLFRSLAATADLPAMRLSLYGRDPRALRAVVCAGRALLADTPVSLSWHELGRDGWEQSLKGASVVVLQARIGGYAGRAFDESFPHRYGVCGDEGLGPGGLSAAWRAWPILARYFQTFQRLAPEALCVVLTSPLGILVRAADMLAPRLNVRGICELPWTTLRGVCGRLGVDHCAVGFDYYGVNHIGWFSRIQFGTRDLLEEYRQTQLASDEFPSAANIEEAGGLPTKYLRLQYEPERVLREQQVRARERAAFLSAYKTQALAAYETGDADLICAALDRRPADWYAHALAPLLLAVAGRHQPVTLFLTKRNEGFSQHLRDDDVLEIPHAATAHCPTELRNESLIPAPISNLVRRFVKYERAAARAVFTRDAHSLGAALRLHPWTPPGEAAERMAHEILQGV